MAARKPLNFTLDAAEPTPVPANTTSSETPRMQKRQPAPEDARQQVGARIRATTYRQLKARAALDGRKVQELVELAVERYLAESSG